MRLVPAVLIPDAQLGAVVEQRFTAGGVAPCQHSVVERRQPSPVLVVRRRTQRQQDLRDDTQEELDELGNKLTMDFIGLKKKNKKVKISSGGIWGI